MVTGIEAKRLRALGFSLTAALTLAGCAGNASLAAGHAVHSTSPPSTTTSPLSGPVGTTYTDASTGASGNQAEMAVTLTQVIDPASGAPYATPGNGDRFVGAMFKIAGIRGTFSGDANIDAVLIGSNQQTYLPSPYPLAGCTNFDSGTFTVNPQQTLVGCVAFQVPTGVSVASIKWNPNSISNSSTSTWTVSP